MGLYWANNARAQYYVCRLSGSYRTDAAQKGNIQWIRNILVSISKYQYVVSLYSHGQKFFTTFTIMAKFPGNTFILTKTGPEWWYCREMEFYGNTR